MMRNHFVVIVVVVVVVVVIVAEGYLNKVAGVVVLFVVLFIGRECATIFVVLLLKLGGARPLFCYCCFIAEGFTTTVCCCC